MYTDRVLPPGRGVFATKLIARNTIIETCPVLILSPSENATHIAQTSLYHYTYNWPRDTTGKPCNTQAVIFGLGSMFNHSSRDQNVGWTRDLDQELVVYRTLRDVQKGEELCISYGARLTFGDVDGEGSDESEEEEGGEVLGRIEVEGL
jgi:SET domain-containing protein